MLLEKRTVQNIVMTIYIITCMIFLLLSLSLANYPLYFNVYCIISPIIAILLSQVTPGKHKFHMYMMATLFLLLTTVYGTIYNSAAILQDAFITCACVCSLYFCFNLNMYMLFYTVVYYVINIIFNYELMVTALNASQQLGVRIALLIIAQIFLLALVSFINRSQQSLIDKSQSSVDLLQIVEIKKQEAVAASKTKADFLANMSHEIRTPMNAIVGMTEMILRDDINPGVRENARNIKSAGNALLSIINDILDFSKIESGKMEIINVRYQLTSVVNDIINIISVKLIDKNLDLVVDVDPMIPAELVGDEIRLRQILLNLLNNAAKFTSEGHITLSVTYKMAAADRVVLHFAVSDTGSGIRDADKERLFSSFQRFDTRQNRSIEGTGLGLSICKRLLELMGGAIRVDSEYGVGSTFSFELPQNVVKESPLAAIEDAKKERVLYIDDSTLYQESARNDLNRLGVSARICKAVSELDDMVTTQYSYIFVSRRQFDECELRIRSFARENGDAKIVVMINKNQLATGFTDVLIVKRPVYSAVFASILSDAPTTPLDDDEFHESFIAPDAKILVVDDNAVNLKVVKGLLEPYQMRVFTSTSGKDCLELLEKGERYNVIFMDHMMPELDGIDTLRLIRKMSGDYFQKVPVVALTANAVSGVREMFFQEGFQDYVSKPIELAKLEKSLKSNLPSEMIIRKQIVVSSEPTPKPDIMLHGVEVDRGLLNCGNDLKNYLELLRVVYEDGTEKCKLIRELAIAKDYKNYTIEVHALKSVAASIGAGSLSELAKSHEFAGYDNNFDFIDSGYEDVISSYESLLNEIHRELSSRGIVDAAADSDATEKATKGKISDEEWAKKLKLIKANIDDFEPDNAIREIQELTEYDIAEHRKMNTKKLLNLVNDFQYDDAMELVDKMLAKK
ncbi:MAG TPA: ATP-binding protein [Bacillota bacterium]|nr:ATP-binding protein [Bacillota bacterium]